VIVMPVEDRAREIWAREYADMYIRAFAGDVIAVITTDEPGGFTYVTKGDLARTGLREGALWRRALRNVDYFARTASITKSDDGLRWIDSDDVSAVALVFSESLWKREDFRSFRGPPVVGLDGRGSFMVADSSDAHAVAAARERLAPRNGCAPPSDYPSFCSRAGNLFVRLPDGKWSVFR
jgi:hypothetical protein